MYVRGCVHTRVCRCVGASVRCWCVVASVRRYSECVRACVCEIESVCKRQVLFDLVFINVSYLECVSTIQLCVKCS